jgi:hypothetical protein
MLNSNLPSKSYKDILAWFVRSSQCQKGIDMPWMIASLADEIEEKADKRVQVRRCVLIKSIIYKVT